MISKSHLRNFFIALGAIILTFSSLKASDTTKNNNRLKAVVIGGSAIYAADLVGLYHLWYKDFPMTKFHWFNDNDEWLLMDKAGHAFTSYYQGMLGYNTLKWAGVEEKKAAIIGGGIGFILQTPIEILDGFSAGWGASPGDLAANGLGSALFISQQLAWHEQKVQMKFSFTPSRYAEQNPRLLGSSLAENVMKDYNGQTYWLSFGLGEVSTIKSIPDWLNLAVGYGADGMLRGTAGQQYADFRYAGTQRANEYYLSLDVNLLALKPKQKWLKTLSTVIAFVKVPSPAVSYHEVEGFRWHYLYF